jgi:RimK family alpha-L-glutamate ligase
VHVDWEVPVPRIEFPVVVKPRFGSWGRDVMRCESEPELRRSLQRLRARAWFRRQGVLVQALVAPAGYDLRIIVAGGRVAGAIERVSAPGEWRTNIALGGRRRRVSPSPDACGLAVAAAAAVGADLVGVDLLPLPDGGYTVLELNGAVDFTREYSLPGSNVFETVADLIDNGSDEPALETARLGC